MGKITRNGVEYGLGGKEILNLIYPVGSIYISANREFDPNVAFGGVWRKTSEGRCLLGANSEYPVGVNGGVTSHSHTTANHTLTIAEMPSHNHPVTTNGEFTVNNGNGNGMSGIPGNTPSWGDRYPSDWWKVSVSYTGGNRPHNHGSTSVASNMPPYLAVNVWQRYS